MSVDREGLREQLSEGCQEDPAVAAGQTPDQRLRSKTWSAEIRGHLTRLIREIRGPTDPRLIRAIRGPPDPRLIRAIRGPTDRA
jgi:hypothetical protein